MWEKEWQSTSVAQHAKFFYLTPNPRKAKFVYKLARLELGRFVRLVNGHNNLNYFQHRIGLWGSDRCRFCDVSPERFTHFLTDCPVLRTRRQDTFLDKIPCNNMEWSVRQLLEFSYLPQINDAFEGTWAHGDPVDVDNMMTGLEDSDVSMLSVSSDSL